jgi:wyosine [tRNA(Phe)-imidazoG37] synthetase (radical SAM superfamily)
LVTTNATTLEFTSQAKKYLPYIDELILSINTLNKDIYQKLHQVRNMPDYEKVFLNINKYWK